MKTFTTLAACAISAFTFATTAHAEALCANVAHVAHTVAELRDGGMTEQDALAKVGAARSTNPADTFRYDVVHMVYTDSRAATPEGAAVVAKGMCLVKYGPD